METELVIRAQRGDRAAFGLLAAEIATRFLAVSRRILRDIDLAEDASEIDGELAVFQPGQSPESAASNIAELDAVMESIQIGP